LRKLASANSRSGSNTKDDTTRPTHSAQPLHFPFSQRPTIEFLSTIPLRLFDMTKRIRANPGFKPIQQTTRGVKIFVLSFRMHPLARPPDTE
jgi:hypothetical protein